MKTWIAGIGMSTFMVGGPLLWSPASVLAAETLFKPFVAISEEATDNIYEQAIGRRQELITRIRPGATFTYRSPLWTWDTAYAFEYRNYARNSRDNEYNHDAASKGNIALVDNFLFIDLSDTYHRISLDISRDAVTESALFLNKTDQNIAVLSPYMLWHLRGDSTLKTGYRFTDTRYWDLVSIDKQEHRGFTELNHEATSKLSVSAGYAFTQLESSAAGLSRQELYGGFRYEYAENSFVSGQIGNNWQQFDSGVNVRNLFWNAGITHDFNFAVATVEARVSTTEDPLTISTKQTTYNGKLEKKMQRSMVGLSASYSDYVNTLTDRTDHRKLSFSATGSYEIRHNITATLITTGERFSRKTAVDYPYRFTGIAGVNYALNNELTLGLTYTHATYLYDHVTYLPDHRTVGAKYINRAVVELKKVF